MWFILALFSMLGYGIFDFLFKLAEQRNYDYATVLIYFYISGALFALALFLLTFSQTNATITIFFAIAQVCPYLIANVLKLESLKHIKSLLAFPILNFHGVFAAIFAVALLNEHLSFVQSAGVFLSILALLILIEKKGRMNPSRGIIFAILAAFFMSLSNIILKIAANTVNFALLIASSYFFAALPSYAIERSIHKRRGHIKNGRVLGVIIGIINVVSFYALLLAIRDGLASVIYPLLTFSLLVSMVISKIIYNEKMTSVKWIAVFIAMLSIVMLRLGT